ncbi:MAG TPA: FAD-binding protein [Thermoanaerobaculia bacterium]|nr:FAD-binding protein [Thermoanaerobaculia bacterium]
MTEDLSRDFGGLIRRRPGQVVRPRSAREVADVLRSASLEGNPVSTRGAGHSQNGQSLSDGGLLLDLRSLDRIETIDVEGQWVEAGAGTLWRDLVAAVADQGLLPPVLTDNLGVTLGGTASVGGVGPASFRHGLQAGHCLALEVATPDGRLVRCSRDEHPELFEHVLCGLSQFGVITRVRHRLRRYRRHTWTHQLLYEDLGRFLADIRRCAAEERADFLDGWALPDRQGPGKRWCYQLLLTVESETPPAAGMLDGLLFDRRLADTDRPTLDHVHRLEPSFERTRTSGGDKVHPWVELFLPFASVPAFTAEILPRLGDGISVLFWPLRTDRRRLPMFVTPPDDLVLLVGLFSSLAPKELPRHLPVLRRASELGIELGGKRYLSGWVDFDADGWRRHFGERWPGVRRAKRAFDPKGLLNPGFLMEPEWGKDVPHGTPSEPSPGRGLGRRWETGVATSRRA